MAEESHGSVVVPYTALTADLLRSVIESFVLREGTDYGEREFSLAEKVARVMRLLERGEAQIIFDPQTESVDIVTVKRRDRSRCTRVQHPIDPPAVIAGHPVSVDATGRLRPWTSWTGALDLEMKFYRQCPADHGYPRFVYVTFLDGDWTPSPDRTDTIPGDPEWDGYSFLPQVLRTGWASAISPTCKQRVPWAIIW